MPGKERAASIAASRVDAPTGEDGAALGAFLAQDACQPPRIDIGNGHDAVTLAGIRAGSPERASCCAPAGQSRTIRPAAMGREDSSSSGLQPVLPMCG